jgi:polar amino acid transport system substrate-binding protein
MRTRNLGAVFSLIFATMAFSAIALCAENSPAAMEMTRQEQERVSRDSIFAERPDAQTKEAEPSDSQEQPVSPGIRPEKQDHKGFAIEVQKELKKLGYYPGTFDGIIGVQSRQALTDFQRDLNLPMTGRMDQETVQRLSRPTLILNTQDFAPFHYKIPIFPEKVFGPVPEIIRAACTEAKINCILRLHDDWGTAQELVKMGQAHGVFVIGWNAERAKTLWPSVPIIETEYGFFVRANDPLHFAQIEDINGYTIGVYGPSNTSGTLRQIENALRNKNMQIHIKEDRDDKPLFKELAEAQSIRAVFSNRDVGNSIIRGLGFSNLRYEGPFKKLLYYVGFSKNLVHKSIVDQFNEAFQNLQRKGVVQEIYANSGLLGNPNQADVQVSTRKEINTIDNITMDKRFIIKVENGQETIVDQKTCLMWQKNGASNQITWNDAKNYVNTLNKNAYAGHPDWRLPKIHELTSLLESDIRKENRLYIDPLFDSMQQTCWSADSDSNDNSAIQFVDFYEGSAASKASLDTNFVRAVRDNSCK